jgi:membrane peptidoglycan carboxypeptidase
MTTQGWWPWGSAPTSPLPADPHLGGNGQEPAWLGGPRAGGEVFGPPPRRRHPLLFRITVTVLVLILLGLLGLGALLAFSPSVSDAPARAQAIDQQHHVAYPGPPVPYRFAAALVSTEDHRFYSEPGIDPFAIARLIEGRLTDRPDQGGATLYVQLAKMLYAPGQSGLLVEAEEVGLGIKLDLTYSKTQILQMYSDVAYFGHHYYGLAAASCGYFGVTPARLSWPQAAMLAGLMQAPSADDPIVHPAEGRARQAHVLQRLVATGVLTQVQADQAFRQQLTLTGGRPGACGTALESER